MVFKWMVLIILTLLYLYNLLLHMVRLRSAGNPIPDNVSDIYDEESFLRWRAYHAEKTRLSIASSTAGYVIDLVLLAFNVYAAFAGVFPQTDFMQMFAVLLLSELSSLLLLPFSWHETMVIEEKYGFNKATAATFLGDQVKSFIIGLVITTGIGAALMYFHLALGDWLIPAFAGITTVGVMIVSFLYPFLSRIFNKFKPLEDGKLKDRLTDLLEKNGYHVRKIEVMDASRRTTKSNAYFSGFGKMKTIVLYDTLVEAMTPEEITAVFAHELGHGLHKDTLRNQILSFVQMLILGVLAWLTVKLVPMFQAFGFIEVNYGFVLILVMNIELALVYPLMSLMRNYFSRRAEYRADAHAVQEGYGAELISALKKLARQNYSELSPSPLLVRLEYTHPPLSRRIDAIEKSISKESVS